MRLLRVREELFSVDCRMQDIIITPNIIRNCLFNNNFFNEAQSCLCRCELDGGEYTFSVIINNVYIFKTYYAFFFIYL